MPRETDKGDKEKTEDLIDVGEANEKATEVDLDKKAKGGILITDDVVERAQVASTCGLVLKVGPDAYKDKERYPEGPWCKKGTWVVFARYAGSRIKIDGGEVRLLNDDEVLATVENPEDIFHEI